MAVYDSFSVSSLGGLATSSRVLDDGAAYTVNVSGFVSIQNAQSRLGDAEYFQVWDSVNKRKTGEWADLSPIGGLDMGVRLSQVTGAGKWGPRNTTGNYSQVVGGTGNRLQVRFIDSPYTDNSGNFSVTVHHDVPVSVSAIEPTAKENNQIAGTFRINRGGSTRYALPVTFSLSGTSSDGAADYTASAASTATIPAGATYVDVTITPVDDAVVETDEAVTLTLRPSTQYDLVAGATSAIVTIEDDDRVVVSIEEFDRDADEVMERAGVHRTGTLHVVRTGKLDDPLLVKVSIGGTATYSALATDDYTLENVTSGWTGYFVTIPAGLSSTQVVVTPIQDGIDEDTETVIVTVEAYTGYELGEPSAQSGTVEILDAPNIAGGSITYQIDGYSRGDLYARAYDVDTNPQDLPPGGTGTLWTGEPYVFSLIGLGAERTDGIAWEIGSILETPSTDFDLPRGSDEGTTFRKVFDVKTEEPLSPWYVRFFVDANRDGHQSGTETWKIGHFDAVEQNRKPLWIQRLKDEQAEHEGMIYDQAFHVTDFFDQLISAAEGVGYVRYNGSANAEYSFPLDEIRILDVEKAEIDTVLDESVHALDDARNYAWLQSPSDKRYTEGLQSAATFLLGRDGAILGILNSFESLLTSGSIGADALQREWRLVQGITRSIGFPVQYLWFGISYSDPGTLDDIQHARDALGLYFNFTTLISAYQSFIDATGTPVTLGPTFVDGGATFSIPDVFLD